MSWPSPSDYQEALQNPSRVFTDLQLQQSQVEFDKLGLPRPISGNFATVFELTTGGRSWAVRCFLREVHDQKLRYDVISRHLRQNQLPFMVGFEYLPQGIRIKGKMFPIVKMEWIRGERLDTYIERNLQRPHKLQALATSWQNLMHQLRHASIAHGDLQHGNIVVTNNDEIKLIDYDGMFVSSLVGTPSNEIGHRNYQHPSRTSDKDVNAVNFTNIDNFSAWVIGISVRLLEIDPSLWTKTQAGDDCLLFKSQDFTNPTSSSTLHLLAAHPNQLIRQYTQKLLSILSCQSYLEVPVISLEINTLGYKNPVKQGDWFRDHLPANLNSAISGSGSWVNDHVEAEKPFPKLSFPLEFLLEEKNLLEEEYHSLSVTDRIKNFYFSLPRYLEVRVKERFNNYPIIVEKRRALAALKKLEEEKNVIALELKQHEAVHERAYKVAEEKHDLDYKVHQVEMRLQEIEGAIQMLQSQEQAEVTNNRQNDLRQNLKFCVLKPGMIPGIGRVRIEKLNRIGISSAYEIEPSRRNQVITTFEGIYNSNATAEWDSLLRWRTDLEGQYSKNPRLTASAQTIQRTYAIKRIVFENERRQKLNQIASLRQEIANTPQLHQSYDQLRILADGTKAKISYLEAKIIDLEAKISKGQRYCARYSQITETKLIEQLRNI